MTKHLRLFSVALAFLFVLGSNAAAASKRKSKGRGGRAHPAAAKPVQAEAAEPAPAKVGGMVQPKGNGAQAAEGHMPERSAAKGESVKQESRIEFDERMLKGQSAAGAIYLFQRSPSEWKSIVEVPGTFRPRTVGVLETDGESK